MICPACFLEIEDDSSYCDQCGAGIMICPQCGSFHHNVKFCAKDNSELVLNNSTKNYLEKNFFTTQRVKNDSRSEASTTVKLINKNLGIELNLIDGDVIGRKSGRFIKELSSYKQISSKHASLSFNSEQGWLITDLGSTNGTKLNDKLLIPTKPVSIKPGDSLVIANLEFFVAL